MLFCVRLILSIAFLMQLWHVIRYKSSHSTSKISRNNCRSVIRIINLTNYKELIITKSLRTIHHDNEVTSLLDDEGIKLLIVVLREIEQDVSAIATITFNTKDRKSLDALYLNIPLYHEGINALKAVLRFAFGINVLKCFSKVRNCVLIVHCRYKT